MSESIKSSWTFGRFLMLQFLAVGLTVLTMLLGAAPLRIVRKFYGRNLFWLSSGVLSFGLFYYQPEVSFGFFSLVVLAGLAIEFERRGWSYKAAALGAISLASATLYTLLSVWTVWNQIDWTKRIEDELAKVTQSNLDVSIDIAVILAQVPSIIVVLMILSMVFSLLWENRLKSLFVDEDIDPVDIQSERMNRFFSFKLPDLCIFALIGSLLFSTVYFGIKPLQIVALNVLNILVVLYMLQGFAVVQRLFAMLNVGTIWRILFYFMLVIQLPSLLLISILGVTDYWIDFREKMDQHILKDKDRRSK